MSRLMFQSLGLMRSGRGPHRGAVCAVRVAILSVLLSAGCATDGTLGGYGHKELYDESVHTIAVPIFENKTFYRGMEFRLTEALAKEIERRTPYKVVKSGSADTELKGKVLQVEKRLISREFQTGVPQEIEVVVVAGFEWKDLRTGQIKRKRGRIEGTGQYVPTTPVSEPFEVASHQAVEVLAREIVSAMRADW